MIWEQSWWYTVSEQYVKVSKQTFLFDVADPALHFPYM